MVTKRIEAAATKAAKQVENIESEFRGYAFQVLFERILSEEGQPARASKIRQVESSRPSESDRGNLVQRVMVSDVDFSKYYTLINNGSWVERVMIVLYVLEKTLKIKALTPPEIAIILKDKLRLSKVHAPNVGRALTGNMETFIRSQEGQAYKYSLSSKGLAEVEKLIGSID